MKINAKINGVVISIDIDPADYEAIEFAKSIISRVLGKSAPDMSAAKPVAVKCDAKVKKVADKPEKKLGPAKKAKKAGRPPKIVKAKNGARAVKIAGYGYTSITEAARQLKIGEKRIRKALKDGSLLDGKKVVAL